MKAYGVQTIYTFNAVDFAVLPDLTVIVPGASRDTGPLSHNPALRQFLRAGVALH